MQSGLAALLIAVCTVPSAGVLRLPSHAVALKTSSCPFGYGEGCGGGGAIDSATKAKVASILEGILKNLSTKKALVQGRQQVRKIGHAGQVGSASMSAQVQHALQGLLATMRQNTKTAQAAKALGTLLAADHPDVSCTYFGACSGGSHPIDAQTKAQVASILEGVLKNLSSQH